MSAKPLLLVAVLLLALGLMPAGAHLLELPNKMTLSRSDYLTVQQIYRGWALTGIVVVPTLIVLAMLAFVSRRTHIAGLTLAAFISFLASHALFWIFTFPANRATNNWTTLPDQWLHLRNQWEYSHAAAAVLTLLSLLLLLFAASRSPR